MSSRTSPRYLAVRLASQDRRGGLSGPFASWRRARFHRHLARVELSAFLTAAQASTTDALVSVAPRAIEPSRAMTRPRRRAAA